MIRKALFILALLMTSNAHGTATPGVGLSLGLKADTQVGPNAYAGFILGIRTPYKHATPYYGHTSYLITGLLFEAAASNDGTALIGGMVFLDSTHIRYTRFEPYEDSSREASSSVSLGYKALLELTVGVQKERFRQPLSPSFRARDRIVN